MIIYIKASAGAEAVEVKALSRLDRLTWQRRRGSWHQKRSQMPRTLTLRMRLGPLPLQLRYSRVEDGKLELGIGLRTQRFNYSHGARLAYCGCVAVERTGGRRGCLLQSCPGEWPVPVSVISLYQRVYYLFSLIGRYISIQIGSVSYEATSKKQCLGPQIKDLTCSKKTSQASQNNCAITKERLFILKLF